VPSYLIRCRVRGVVSTGPNGSITVGLCVGALSVAVGPRTHPDRWCQASRQCSWRRPAQRPHTGRGGLPMLATASSRTGVAPSPAPRTGDTGRRGSERGPAPAGVETAIAGCPRRCWEEGTIAIVDGPPAGTSTPDGHRMRASMHVALRPFGRIFVRP